MCENSMGCYTLGPLLSCRRGGAGSEVQVQMACCSATSAIEATVCSDIRGKSGDRGGGRHSCGRHRMSWSSSSSFRACLLSITHVYACAVSTVLMRPWVSRLKTKLWIVTGWRACCPNSMQERLAPSAVTHRISTLYPYNTRQQTGLAGQQLNKCKANSPQQKTIVTVRKL